MKTQTVRTAATMGTGADPDARRTGAEGARSWAATWTLSGPATVRPKVETRSLLQLRNSGTVLDADFE